MNIADKNSSSAKPILVEVTPSRWRVTAADLAAGATAGASVELGEAYPILASKRAATHPHPPHVQLRSPWLFISLHLLL